MWKLPNSYCAHFARKFMRKYPEHAGFFRIRRLTSADAPAISGPEIGPKDISEGDE